jgi:CRP-like cAMP-binding protein
VIAPVPPTGNSWLGALSEEVYGRLQPHLKLIALPLGKIICEPGQCLTHVIFPAAGIVSLLTPLQAGTSEESAIVGHEGVIGISAILEGVDTARSRYRIAVTTAGEALQLPAGVLLEEFARGGELRSWLLRYTQARITQIAQIAACNRHHTLEMQVCRWLLMRLDRTADSELLMTQEQIAVLLGVRREAITEAAGRLQSRGVIRYGRGHIAVLDRPGLERQACECYAAIKKEYARLLGVAAPAADTPGVPAQQKTGG